MLVLEKPREPMWHSLGWVCRVDDHGVLGFVIDDEVGVVVGTTNPYASQGLTPFLCVNIPSGNKMNVHMGIDWICMARVRGSCGQESAVGFRGREPVVTYGRR
jgi:hypothetical protein